MTEQLVPLQLIDDNPFQDRGVYDDIEELGRVIAVNGLEQKPKARLVGKRYQLKFGHRRKRAFDWLAKNWKKEGLPDRYNGYTVMPLEVEEITDQEMFDGVVIENVHRDDLKVTEKARLLRRYKEVNPQATSEKIGLVFNMAPATVRGMDIFLDLPEEVQAALDAGEISMGTARALHSMQRVAPQEVVVSTFKRIGKEKGNRLPEEVIEHDIERLNNAVELWDERHSDGKPRARRDGWQLDMKSFPNQYLPRMNEQMVAAYEKQIEHLTNPPTCTACPMYTKVRGGHYCGLKVCFERKQFAWAQYLMEQASKQLGITIYSEADGAYRGLDYDDAELFKKRHKGLRLFPRSQFSGYGYYSFQGVNTSIFVVVATGDALNRLHGRSSGTVRGGKKTEKEKAEMRAMRLYRIYRKELLWDFTAAAKSVFASTPYGVLEIIEGRKYIGIDDRIPDTWEVDDKAKANEKAEHFKRMIIYSIIIEDSSHYRRETMKELLGDLEKRAKAWGVKIPAALVKRAQEWDAEIKAVSTATKG